MIEEKETLMVTPTGGDPFHKKAYFLKPTNQTPPFNLSHFLSSLPTSSLNPKKLLPVFHAWHQHHHYLESWFHHLAPQHQPTWEKAGIYQPILTSMYRIKPQKDLLFGLAEKWCNETNTFMFPWGEATLTLEDVVVLGGFSVLGAHSLSPVGTREMRKVEAKLEKERLGLYNARCRTATACQWAKRLIKSGSEIEHEAFLVFWLTKYVFPYNRDCVNKDVFRVAIRLAKGVRVALAPAVLASVYDDLSVLNRAVMCSNELGAVVDVVLMSQMQLVQVWAWERFTDVRPKPEVICCGEPRMARWNNIVKGMKVSDMSHVRKALDSAGEGFLWRPYAIVVRNLRFPKYYFEEEKWVSVGAGLDEGVLSFAMFLRVAKLAGFRSNQKYLPHRVARQFGFDQDLPYSIWGYNCSYENEKLYIPSRLSEADVTVRYLNWWNESWLGAGKKCRNSKRLLQPYVGRNDGEYSLVPPGFSRKRNILEARVPIDEDDLTISEALMLKKKLKTVETKKGTAFQNLSCYDQIFRSSLVDESSMNTEYEILPKPVAMSDRVLTWRGKRPRNQEKVISNKERSSSVVSIIGDTSPRNTYSYGTLEFGSSMSFLDKQECASSSLLFDESESTSSGFVFGKLEADSINSAHIDENTSVNSTKTEIMEEQAPLIWGGKGRRKMKPAMRYNSYKARCSASFDNGKEGYRSPLVEYRASELQTCLKRLENVVQMLKENTFGRRSLIES